MNGQQSRTGRNYFPLADEEQEQVIFSKILGIESKENSLE
jgi:hypothetical protein